jgi:hypothetical protein
LGRVQGNTQPNHAGNDDANPDHALTICHQAKRALKRARPADAKAFVAAAQRFPDSP